MDIESFPYASKAFPQLAEHGAYHPREIYTAADIAQVVQHALGRGIRVIPEIDTPGHVWAGFAAIDGLLTTCYEGSEAVGTGPLDPSKVIPQATPSHYHRLSLVNQPGTSCVRIDADWGFACGMPHRRAHLSS